MVTGPAVNAILPFEILNSTGTASSGVTPAAMFSAVRCSMWKRSSSSIARLIAGLWKSFLSGLIFLSFGTKRHHGINLCRPPGR